MPLAMLPNKSLQHCQEQMIRANIASFEKYISSMVTIYKKIDVEFIFALDFAQFFFVKNNLMLWW